MSNYSITSEQSLTLAFFRSVNPYGKYVARMVGPDCVITCPSGKEIWLDSRGRVITTEEA